MIRRCLIHFVTLLGFGCGSHLLADEVRIIEEDGVQIRETRYTDRRPVAEVQMRSQTETLHRPQYVTEVRAQQRTTQVPVVEYRWQPRVLYPWGILGDRQVVHEMVPYTRWVPRTETVTTPVTYIEYVPETRVVEVPVRTLRFVEEEKISRVVLGSAPKVPTNPTQPSALEQTPAIVAQRTGNSSRFDSDPPKRPVPTTILAPTIRR